MTPQMHLSVERSTVFFSKFQFLYFRNSKQEFYTFSYLFFFIIPNNDEKMLGYLYSLLLIHNTYAGISFQFGEMSNAIALLTISTHKITYTTRIRESEPVTAIFVILLLLLLFLLLALN